MQNLKCYLFLLAITTLVAMPLIAAETEGFSNNLNIDRSNAPGETVMVPLVQSCNLINF